MISRPDWCAEDEPFIRLSHSTLEALMSCERKFEMDKLLTFGAARQESEHFSFGHSFGTFAACYLETGSFEISTIEGWLAYQPIIETEKKNVATAYHLFLACRDRLDELREEYEVAVFDGRPAVELSFRIDIDDVFYYVGYVDVVLKHKTTGKYVVLDFKTTGLLVEDISPLYKFSGQLLGYSIVLDEVAGPEAASYEVMYFVGRLGKTPLTDSTRPEVYTFKKNLQDRLEWFLGVSQDVERLHTCMQTNNFPRRLHGCLRFNKPCPHFGVCHMRSGDQYRTIENEEKEYQFTYRLDDLIDSHIERIQQ